MHILRASILVFVLMLASVGSSNAQQNFLGANEVLATGTAYYTFARPGEATVRVLVIGAGGGMYEIGAQTRMDEFLALLGGAPQFATESPGTRTSVDVQLFRIEDGRRSLLYEEELDTMIMEPAQYPVLQDGDVFVVRTQVRNRFGWRDGLNVLSSVSSVLLILDRVGAINLRRR